VTAMTDVTGFGLLGHLTEMCQGASLSATVKFNDVPVMPGVFDYIGMGCFPGGTERNFASYGSNISKLTPEQKALLCDPQTSGGLLVSVRPENVEQMKEFLTEKGIQVAQVGEFVATENSAHLIEVL